MGILKKCFVGAVAILFVSGEAIGQTIISKPVNIANYEMDVALDVAGKYLNAHTKLLWINPSPDTVRELQFHLYYNAFKNDQSTWMLEDEVFMEYIGNRWYEECGWSWSVIHSMHDAQNQDLTKNFEFIRPEDQNPSDETVLRVPLINPVMPYDSAEFEFSWRAKIPRGMVRTGYNKDFYFFAQWFPKLGVYEPAGMRYAVKGAWNCHQYHVNSEYYADFGRYVVHLTVPEVYVVGATGLLVGQQSNQDRHTTTYSYAASEVIDFAWTASPHFQVSKSTWKDVEISVMHYPEHKAFLPRYEESMIATLSFLDTHIGDYPYPNITIVDPPLHGTHCSGMEYPTLITTVSTPLLPRGFRSTETLVAHEFVHQYFMQMVATNEQEEPWMDEGITSYYEGRILDEYYGPQTSMFDQWGIHVGNFEFNRHQFFNTDHVRIAPNTLPSWEYTQEAYGALSYNKVALWLKTLEGLTGTDVFDEMMRTYFERWKYRHPCGRDFVAVVNEITLKRLPEKFPEGMDWFFKQVLEGTSVCDYSVASITNARVSGAAGFVGDTVSCIQPVAEQQNADVMYNSRVTLYRLGDMYLPLEVQITFADGSSIRESWDGKEAMHQLSFQGKSRILSAEIDPDRKNALDLNYINDSLTLKSQSGGHNAYFTRCLKTIQHFMETISMFM